MVRMVHSAFAGTVTADTSISSQRRKCSPPPSRKVYSWGRKPTDSPLTSPVLMAAQTSSSRAASCDGISGTGFTSVAVISSPSLTRRTVHCPTGREWSCCQRNGIALPNSAPSGSRMSPSRSGEGVDAIPVITRSSSLKDFTVSRVQARLRVTSAS
ncbi:Uncharacterised protein [Escherichia coli]|nr:Uncharacterised protein [Escherichia coli]